MSREYLDYVHDLFSAFAPVATRAMFGGYGVYRDGVILALVIDETLYLKVDAQTRAAFEAEACRPFVYESKGKAVPMSYWSVPDEALDSPQDFRPWAQRAWEAALRKRKPENTAKKPKTPTMQ
jgi:DNA transformation protein